MTELTTDIFGAPSKSRLKYELYNIINNYNHNLFETLVHALVDDIYEHLHNFVRLTELMNYENNDD